MDSQTALSRMRPHIDEAQGKPLSSLHAEIFQAYWNKVTQQAIAKKMNCTAQSLKSANTILFKVLSEITGQPVTSRCFRQPIEAFLKAQDNQKQAEAGTEVPDIPEPILWNVPDILSPHFTGRSEELQKLREQLLAKGIAGLSQVQTISDFEGIGKTQTALAYAHRHRQDYSAVFWVRANTDSQIYRVSLLLPTV
jgi:hypothetical protein